MNIIPLPQGMSAEADVANVRASVVVVDCDLARLDPASRAFSDRVNELLMPLIRRRGMQARYQWLVLYSDINDPAWLGDIAEGESLKDCGLYWRMCRLFDSADVEMSVV